MRTGRPKAELKLTEEEQEQLRSFTLSRTLPNALVARAKVILGPAQGKGNGQIAQRLGWTNATVGKCCSGSSHPV